MVLTKSNRVTSALGELLMKKTELRIKGFLLCRTISCRVSGPLVHSQRGASVHRFSAYSQFMFGVQPRGQLPTRKKKKDRPPSHEKKFW